MGLLVGDRRVMKLFGVGKVHVTVTSIIDANAKDPDKSCYGVTGEGGEEIAVYGYELHPARPSLVINTKERDMIIAALRMWQGVALYPGILPELVEIADNGRQGADAHLSNAEIDKIIERIKP